MSEPTQVVIIITDSQGINIVGCYGRPEMRTPHLDRLAAEGMRFDRAYTTSPVCGPAPLRATHRNLSAHQRQLGQPAPPRSERQDRGPAARGAEPAGRIYRQVAPRRDGLLRQRPLPRGVGPRLLVRYAQVSRGDVAGGPPLLPPRPHLGRTPRPRRDRGVYVRASVRGPRPRFLAQHDRQDFLLVVSFDEPHHPSLCPPSFAEMFEHFDYALGENASDPMTDKPAHHREWAEAMPSAAGTAVRAISLRISAATPSWIPKSAACLEAVDIYAPHALVIYTSDHGEPLLSHGLCSKGPAMYEEAAHIPFLVRWPGQIAAGSVNPHPVSQIDLTPTILDVFRPGLPALPGGTEPGRRPSPSPPHAAGETIFLEFNRLRSRSRRVGRVPAHPLCLRRPVQIG